MNSAIWWRLAWKEHRLLRGFWAAAWALGGICLTIMAWRMKTTDDPANLFFVAMGIMACYAAGCGAVAFAGECEARTDDFQRVLPLTARQLLIGKLCHALVTTVVLGVVLWTMAWLAACWLGQGREPAASAAAMGALPALLGGLTAIQLLAWSIFFSLRSSTPLRVVILAFLANAVISYPISWLLSDVPERWKTFLYFPSFFGDLPTVVPRLIVVALVLRGDFYLVRRWFLESPGEGRAAFGREVSTAGASTGWWSCFDAWPQWQRLVWQEWRSGKSTLWLIAAVYVLLVTLLLTFDVRTGYDPGTFLGPLMVVGGLLGTFVFHHDQRRRQVRFLAEHGVSPNLLWWSRQSFWFPLLPVRCVAVSLVEYVCIRMWVTESRRDWQDWIVLGAILGMTLICYAVGQLSSLWIRSAVVRVTMAVLVSIPLVFWVVLMGGLRIPLIWSVVPIPLVLLVASWAGVRDWMCERTGVRVRLKQMLTLVIPALAILAAVIAFRWTEIPYLQPTFTTRPLTPAERTAAKTKGEQYLLAMVSFKPGDLNLPPDLKWQDNHLLDGIDPAEFEVNWLSQEQIKWLDEHRELIERTLEVTPGAYLFPSDMEPGAASYYGEEAHRPSDGWGKDAWVRFLFEKKVYKLSLVLIKSAQRCQKENDLDGALDRYVAAAGIMTGLRDGSRGSLADRSSLCTPLNLLRYWAGAPGQTAERVRRAMQAVEQTGKPLASHEQELERFYRVGQQCLAGNEEAFREESAWWVRDAHAPSFYKWFYRVLPWEWHRAWRLHNTSVAYDLAALDRIQRALAQNEPVQIPGPDMELWRWSDTTVTPVRRSWPPHVFFQCTCLVDITAVQRATLIVLALQGWRLEHGALPRTLDELSPTWLAQVPVDPKTGLPFQYHPDGVADPIHWRDDYVALGISKFALPPHRPFIEADRPSPVPSDLMTSDPGYAPTRLIFTIPVSQ